MDLFQWINTAILSIGVPIVAKVLIDVGGVLKKLDVIDEDIKFGIKPDLKELKEKSVSFEMRFTRLESDFQHVDNEVRELKSDVKRVDGEVRELKSDIKRVNNDVREIKTEFSKYIGKQALV